MKPILEEQHSSATETAPLCPAFGQCQGCLYQNIPYSDELEIKEQWLRDILKTPLDISDDLFLPITASPKPYHYRNRLDLKLKRTREKGILIGFTPVDRRGILPVEACFIAEENISSFIPTLKKEAIARLPPKYRVANLVVRTGDDGRVLWGGIGRRSCTLTPREYLWTTVAGKKIFYSLDTFFQANLSILPKLFDEIHSFDFWDSNPVFYDLYGGVGLFGICLAEKAGQVILIEENPASFQLARYNRKANNVKNFKAVKGKVEDKLPELLKEYPGTPKVAMIDPPRAGLSSRACRHITGAKEFDFLLYLSCNPESLARDLEIFVKQGWTIMKIRPFDFFPKTKHLETLVLLSSATDN